jgi:hypothetical protein
MIYSSSTFTRGAHPRPSEDIDPKLKESKPDYSLAMSKYIYSSYMGGRCFAKPGDQDRFATLRSYSYGNQDPNIYKDILCGKAKGPTHRTDEESEWASIMNDRAGMYSINFDEIFSPANLYMDNIIGMFNDIDYSLECEAVDERSGTQRDENKYRDLVEGAEASFFEYVNLMMDMPGQGPQRPLPSNAEELDMFQQMGSYKLAYEVAMGDALKITANLSSDKKVQRAVIRDLLTFKNAFVFCYNDASGVVRYRYVPWEDVILESSMEEDHSDSSWMGWVEYMTIADYRADNPDATDDEAKSLAERFMGVLGNASDRTEVYADGTTSYDTYRIPVLNAYWKGVDTEYTTYHVDGGKIPEPYRKDGLKPPRIINNNKRKTKGEPLRRLYSAKWVIDTDITYKYERCKDIAFDFFAKDVKMPCAVFSIPGKPIVEQMIPILDHIQLTYLTLQNAIAKSPPPGLAVDIGSLNNITFGTKKLHPLDSIKIYTQTGNLIYKLGGTIPGQGQTVNQKPVEQLLSTVDAVIARSLQSMEGWWMELSRITGISPQALAQVDPNQGLGVTQISLATTSNTLKPVLIGWRTIKQNTGTYCAHKIQSVILNQPQSECPYYELLGAAKYNAIKTMSKNPPAAWGCFIKATLDPTIKKALLDAAASGLQVGQNGIPILALSDFLFIVDKIENGGNVTAIRAFIAYKEQKAKEESMARANQAKVLEGQVNEQLANTKAQNEQAIKKMDYEIQVGQIQEKFKADAALRRLDHEFKLQEQGTQQGT